MGEDIPMKKYDLYASVKPTYGLKDFSYAQDFLLTLLEKRVLRAFCAEHKIPHADIYRMVTGERQPGYYIILALRFVIPPMWWFTPITEKKPQLKKIKNIAKEQDRRFENSIAYIKFFTAASEQLIKDGFDYQFIYRLTRGKTKTLTFTRMQELQKKINPALWFIFKGEV